MAVKLKYNEDHVGKVSGWSRYYEATLTLDTNQYAAGDVLSDVFEIPNAFRAPGKASLLIEVGVLDEDDQGQAFDILFFRTSKFTLAAKNAAWATSDADMRKHSFTGKIVRVTSGDYVDLGANRVANLTSLNRLFHVPANPDGSTSIWVATISQGTGTYSASGLRLSFSFLDV